MSIGRNHDSALRYRAGDKKSRSDMIMFATCDTGYTTGLLRSYTAMDLQSLKRITNRLVSDRASKMKRKADFYFVMARIAERTGRLEQYPLP